MRSWWLLDILMGTDFMLLILGSLPEGATSTEAISIMKEGTGYLQPRVQNAYSSISVKGACPCRQGKSHPFTGLAVHQIRWPPVLSSGAPLSILVGSLRSRLCLLIAPQGPCTEDVYTHSLSVTAVCLCCQVRHLALCWLPAALTVPTNRSNPLDLEPPVH